MTNKRPTFEVLVTFNYHETDDASASIYGMTLSEIREFIQEHNEYFETNYESVQEFNDGEARSNGIRFIEAQVNYVKSN